MPGLCLDVVVAIQRMQSTTFKNSAQLAQFHGCWVELPMDRLFEADSNERTPSPAFTVEVLFPQQMLYGFLMPYRAAHTMQ